MEVAKIAIGSWAFSFGPFENNPWSFEAVSRYASENGYDGIEINGFRPHPHPADYDTDEKCAKLKSELQSLGLGISAYASDFNDVPPALVEERLFLAEVRRCLDFCRRMGIDILRVDTISPPDALEQSVYDERFKRLTENWRAAAELCKSEDVTMVWEFEPGFWLNKPSEVFKTVESVGHSHFKLLFDTSHAYMCAVIGARQVGEKEVLKGGVIELGEMLRPHIGHWHLIDSDGTLHGDETSTHAPFGTGQIDFDAFFRAFQKELTDATWWTCDFCFCATTEQDGRDAIPFIKSKAASVPAA